MTLRRRFNYAEYVEGYREACKPWGIDPQEGANGYQVVHVRAEQTRRLWDATWTKERHWWKRHELWQNCPPYRSETEGDAIFHLFVLAYRVTVRVLVTMATMRYAARAALPLRELHEQWGKKAIGD